MNQLFVVAAIFVLLCVALLCGCASNSDPDLARLYKVQSLQQERNVKNETRFYRPVILIHGAFGARLQGVDSGDEVWPGNIARILFSDYEDLALTIDPITLLPKPSNLEVTSVTSQVAGKDFYGAILRTLEDAGGYVRGTPGVSYTGGHRQYYLFMYDWRYDNLIAARQLDVLIEQIRRDYASPDLKVDIVAHSMGAMIARYYLRYGSDDVLDDNEFPVTGYGSHRVNKVILLGSPNLGSVSAMRDMLQGLPVGLNSIPTEVMMTWPSSYQVLPHPIRTVMVTVDGRELRRDLFDVEIWRRFEWSIFKPEVRAQIISDRGEEFYETYVRYFEKNLERARRFVWSLSVPTPDTPVRYIVFGGGCELTPARFVLEEVEGETMMRLYPEDILNPVPGVDYSILMLEPGDGRVTKPSLYARAALDPSVPRHKYSYFPLDYAVMLCETHDTLTGNVHFQDNMLNVLLTQERPLERGDAKNH